MPPSFDVMAAASISRQDFEKEINLAFSKLNVGETNCLNVPKSRSMLSFLLEEGPRFAKHCRKCIVHRSAKSRMTCKK